MKTFLLIFFLLSFISCKTVAWTSTSLQNQTEVKIDSVAERMLIFQRNNGGWSQPGGDPVNYSKLISASLKAKLLADKNKLDATIDDRSTTLEIKTLLTAYKNTSNKTYLKAAENGIKYLLTAQNEAGGWGQWFPDTSGYHKHITYNDNAMIDVMWVLKYASEGTNDFETIDKTLVPKAKLAVANGIQCILKTQIVQNGTLVAWCAQHDRITLKPAKARKFELPSISGHESVGIVEFLMSIEKPTPEIKKSINSAVAWFEKVKIVGIKVQEIKDASLPKGRDRVVVQDPNSTVWARFYWVDTNVPFFTGRDSVPRANLADIENERRVGYAYYGTWPAKLLATDYPKWRKNNE